MALEGHRRCPRCPSSFQTEHRRGETKVVHRNPERHRFRVGQKVELARELHGIKPQSVGVVRGASAGADGVRYAVRFPTLTRVVDEANLSPASD